MKFISSLFTDEEILRIKNITIYDILMAVTKMNPDDLPKNPFNAPLRKSTYL